MNCQNQNCSKEQFTEAFQIFQQLGKKYPCTKKTYSFIRQKPIYDPNIQKEEIPDFWGNIQKTETEIFKEMKQVKTNKYTYKFYIQGDEKQNLLTLMGTKFLICNILDCGACYFIIYDCDDCNCLQALNKNCVIKNTLTNEIYKEHKKEWKC